MLFTTCIRINLNFRSAKNLHFRHRGKEYFNLPIGWQAHLEEFSLDKLKEDIIEFVKANSSFSCDDESSLEELSFTTREHGDILDGEYSFTDYKAGVDLAAKIKEMFNITFKVDTCDEWVNVFKS